MEAGTAFPEHSYLIFAEFVRSVTDKVEVESVHSPTGTSNTATVKHIKPEAYMLCRRSTPELCLISRSQLIQV